MAVATVVVVVIVVLAVVRLLPAGGGGTGLPAVLSVLPEPSNTAMSTGWSLANNTSGGPWTPELAEGWDNTEGLSQVPSSVAGNASCPLEGAAISRYGVLGYNGSYSTGYAEGWFWLFTSPYDGGSNLFVWVGDGTAYEIGTLVGGSCVLVRPIVETGTVYTSTGAASAGASATNYSRFARTYPTANASYLLFWALLGSPAKAVPFWTISFDACNGTTPEASETGLYGSNGTVQRSTYGPGSGAICGSSDSVVVGPAPGAEVSRAGLGRFDDRDRRSSPAAREDRSTGS